MTAAPSYSVGILHGAGYAGGELLKILLSHPSVHVRLITSRSFAGRPIWEAHPTLRGATELSFSADATNEVLDLDVVFLAAEHGQAAAAVQSLVKRGYEGIVIDLSADFRFRDPLAYEQWFGFTHPAPELIEQFQYGLPEIFAPYPEDTRFVANPGCFASGLTLALWPLSRQRAHVAVTALTGASGSGARPRDGTHFPTRDGNVRAYKVLAHQHLPEVMQTLGDDLDVAFIPASGPWTRGIWGTAVVEPALEPDELAALYENAYGGRTFVRCWPDQLPEMRYSVGTPFCDVGWIARDGHCVVGFGLDNLLKGAASQAVQNMNLVLGLSEGAGLLGGSVALSPINTDA